MLKIPRLKLVNAEHLENIPDMSVTLLVLKLERVILINEEHPAKA